MEVDEIQYSRLQAESAAGAAGSTEEGSRGEEAYVLSTTWFVMTVVAFDLLARYIPFCHNRIIPQCRQRHHPIINHRS